MTTLIRIAVCALALSVPGGFLVQAAEPAPPPKTGRVLILDNGRVLEGDIERVGDQYRLRRSIGETWLSAAKVQHLCDSVEEGYAFLRRQANLHDADERLRLAKWCQLHGLRSQALAEITAAVELRPQHAESRRLWQSLQRSEVGPAPQDPRPANEPVPPPPVVEYNVDALGLFVTRVQPILMNACACCHAAGKGGSFHLTRAYDGDVLNRKATQQNLAAVLAHANRDRPLASTLLARAVSIHGDADQPPIKNRQMPAYRLLEEWVQLAVANTTPIESPLAVSVPAIAQPRIFGEVAAGPARTVPPLVPAAPPTQPAPTAPPPVPPTTPSDPFDPMIFNSQMHPPR